MEGGNGGVRAPHQPSFTGLTDSRDNALRVVPSRVLEKKIWGA